MDPNSSACAANSAPPPVRAATRTPSVAAVASKSRDIPLTQCSAIIVVDMQNAFVHQSGFVWEKTERSNYVESALQTTIKNISDLLAEARKAGVEVIYTVVESLTKDGRERSLDYKVSGFNIPRGSWGAQVVDALAPIGDEIVLPKGSSSVFISTNLSYILRNLGVEQCVFVGGLTDQCIDSAVRDACDLGFLATTVTDACYTHSAERHRSALFNCRGYTRQAATAQLLSELAALQESARSAPSTMNALPRGVSKVVPRGSISDPREYLRFEITDINGKALSKLVPMRHRSSKVYLYSGALAFGSNSEMQTIPDEILAAGCPNSELIPDWTTEKVLPWASAASGAPAEGVRVSRVLCEQLSPDGRPGPCPRAACRRLLDELAAFDGRGLQLLSASELEFCVAEKHGRKPLFDDVEVFVTLQNAKTAGYQYALETAMHAVGVDIQTMNAEYGPGQLEITFAPKFGIEGPDDTATFRTAVKEIAQLRGFCATFSSKPFSLTGNGNGGHFNFSLWEPTSPTNGNLDAVACDAPNQANLRSIMRNSEDDECPLSKTARQFLAGILYHAPALEAICAPTPCCYARHGNWAPTCANWAVENRLCAVRVKCGETPAQTYLELRSPSSAANAYLVVTALVAAGLDGLARKMDLPREGMSEKNGAKPLPSSLPDALSALQADAFLVKRMGADLVRWFVGVKQGELDRLQKWIDEDVAKGMAEEDARLSAWQKMYFEYI